MHLVLHSGSLDALDALVQWERGIEFNDLNHRPSSHEREGHPKSPLPAPKMKLLIGTKS